MYAASNGSCKESKESLFPVAAIYFENFKKITGVLQNFYSYYLPIVIILINSTY